MKLSVIIPTYNEEKRVGVTIKSTCEYLEKLKFDYEVLVVSDGSKDGTVSLVEGLQKQFPKVILLDNKQNHGKGWVVKQGMLQAAGDVRVFMDADNSTKIDEIQKFLPFFEQGYDVVVGSRRIKGSNVTTDQKPIREFLGWCFRTIVHILVPVSVTDTQCGFKAFSKNATEKVFVKQTIFRWAFDVEILALALQEKLKIKEVAITWVNDENSHVKFSGMVNMLLEIIQIRLNLWFGKYK